MSEKIATEMSIITEPRLSMDKITLLINTGAQFSYSSPFALDPFNKKIDSFVKEMMSDCFKRYPDSFDISRPHSEETELYYHHYRLAGGVDLQLCPKFGVRHKEYDEGYIRMVYGYGSEELKSFCEDGYIWENLESEYGARLEFNPEKDDFSLCAPFLAYFLNTYCDPEILFDDLLKISRLDIAVDYPEALNPCLFSSTAVRGNQHFGPHGVETLYLGTRRSQYQFRIYDKKCELLKEHNTHYQGSDLWRIELESRPSVNIGEDLNFYSDVFNRLDYYYGRKTGEYKYDWFLNYAMHHGIQNALKTISDYKTRRKFKEFFINLDFYSLKHPKKIVGWQFPKLWRAFYDEFKSLCGRKDDPFLYARNPKETI